MILGITGSIGSGKTTAAKLFGKHNYKVIDADEIAHGLLKNDSKIYKKIADEFGKEILDENKDIDRKKLGEVAFNDDKKLKKLNSIMHPAIAKDIKNKISEIRDKCGNKTRIMIDAPLLLESGARGFVDKIIVVDAGIINILKRNMKFSQRQIERILKLQMPLKAKLGHADFVIDNSKDLKYLEHQVAEIAKALENDIR